MNLTQRQPVVTCLTVCLSATMALCNPLLRLTYDDAPGGVLRVERVAPEGGNADVMQNLNHLDRGTVKVSWKQTIESYTQGSSKPNIETLYTMRLLNSSGQLFFHVGFLGKKQGEGGPIIASRANGELGTWKPGQTLTFVVVMNLDANTCTISINGEVRAKDIPVNRPGALNYVQFRNGTGLGLQDGSFKLTLDDVEVSVEKPQEKLLERYRCTPPVDNPLPKLNPRPSDAKSWTVPGEVKTSWVGNTFNGASGVDGHQNGFGAWVQNGIAPAAFAVSPDGTVVAGVGWDEAGRCIGLYKDGKVNTRIVAQYDMRGGHQAWGFGSANNSVAADGEWIYVGNHEGHLMRFRWKPGDLDSHAWVDQLELGKDWIARTLAARNGFVAALFNTGEIRIWKVSTKGFVAAGQWLAPQGARAMCYAPDGSLWFVAGDKVLKVSPDGKPIANSEITDAGVPSALSVATDGTLVVCDNGPRQQVRFYNVSGASPKFQKAFGDEGGLRSGIPGTPGPRKLYGLAGAGLDAAGNLYVGCSFHPASRGTAVKAFDPTGKGLWDLQCHAFTDGYSFDPASDGTEIVGVDELFSIDLTKSLGQEWSLKAMTLDPLRYPADPRVTADGHGNCGAMLRRVGGKRLLYTIGMQSGGFNLFAFEEGPGHVSHAVNSIGQRGTWAWSVDAKGDIWLGDPGDGTVKRYRFLKWNGDRPEFATQAPDCWPAPAGFDKIQRVHYDTATDTLYVAGFPNGVRDPAWGEVGAVLERYDGWTTGKPVKRWRAELPVDDEKVYPKAMDIVGDYAFVVAVKPVNGQTGMIYVYKLADGTQVGRIWPGKAVGGFSGWVDITHAIAAFRRSNGEYLVLVEEDFRGKCILYRWTP